MFIMHKFLSYSFLSSVLLITFAWTESRPNIVLIMADDLAWAYVGYNGNEFYETPNIDRIAKAGMIFDRGYSEGQNCLPTKACLISGMYTPRIQILKNSSISENLPLTILDELLQSTFD